MLTLLLIFSIIAISLNYFTTLSVNKEGKDIISNKVYQQYTIIILLIILPILWEGCGISDINIYNNCLTLSPLNLSIWLVIILAIILIGMVKQEYVYGGNHTFNERIIFTICAIIGAIILNSAVTSLTFLLGLELQSYSVYILAASYRNYEPSEAAGLKYFLLGALSSALIFMGLGLLYNSSGSINLNIDTNSINQIAGIVLIFSGLAWKIAAAPIHAWSIDVYDAVPSRTTAILSLLPKIALLSVIIRIITLLSSYSIGIYFVMIFIILSLLVGSIAGLYQPRIKRLLAYSSILNVGFILMGGLLCNSILDIPTFYIIQYILVTAAIWLCLISIHYSSDITLISQLQGTGTTTRTTFIASILTILILSTAGIPPMVGFYAKYSIIVLAIESGYISLALIAVIASIISTVYYLGVVKMIWTKSNIKVFTLNTTVRKEQGTLIISVLVLITTLYLLQYSVGLAALNL